MIAMHEVSYKCSKCPNVMIMRVEAGEVAMPAWQCIKCGAGSGISLNDQISQHIGMFPVSRIDEATGEAA